MYPWINVNDISSSLKWQLPNCKTWEYENGIIIQILKHMIKCHIYLFTSLYKVKMQNVCIGMIYSYLMLGVACLAIG